MQPSGETCPSPPRCRAARDCDGPWNHFIQVGSEIVELSSSLSDRFDALASRIQRDGEETNAVDAQKMAFKAPSNDVAKPLALRTLGHGKGVRSGFTFSATSGARKPLVSTSTLQPSTDSNSSST
jgi:hypothetical protein